MDNQKAFNIGLVLLMIAGFTTIAVINPETGEPMESTHYSESLGVKVYCARTTAQYCYPSLETRKGSRRSISGWKLIPEPVTVTTKVLGSGGGREIVCDKIICTATS